MREPIDNPQRRDFYAHQHLPDTFVPRLGLLAELKELLLADDRPVALTSSILRKVSLHGMGGMGKSVMARALCDDREIRQTFPDGILWVTLGQEPNLRDKLDGLVRHLGGRFAEPVPSLERLQNELAKLLKDGQFLLIVDDIWQSDHLKPFLVDAPRCQLLMTTRIKAVAEHVQARLYPIPPMELPEAVNLLEARAGDSLKNAEPAIKQTIAQRLHRLPLALKLAGGRLRDTTPAEWLKEFQTISDLENYDPQSAEDSLRISFELSLKPLDEDTRALYLSLGIFPQDEAIPEAAVAVLWEEMQQFSSKETAKLLRFLDDRALLQLETRQPPLTFRLHDFLRDFALDKLRGQIKVTHQKLLNGYQRKATNEIWSKGPKDGYFFEHLAYHLHQAGHKAELYALLSDGPAWMEAKFKACGGDSAICEGFGTGA